MPPTAITRNAIKFTSKGHVHIFVSSEIINNEFSIRFDIEDTGIGIAKQNQNKIFEPFTQADGSTTRKFGGTGLGLTITKQLVELMGGNIYLTSEPGQGATFSIVVPANLDVSSDFSPNSIVTTSLK